MAEIVFGFGTSHSPLLSTPPDMWHLRVQADKQNPSLEFRGKSYVFDQLVKLRADENLVHQSSLPVRTKRHAACQSSIELLKNKLTKVDPDILIIIGNDQREVFSEDFTPAISMLNGDTVEHSAISPERLKKMPPGIGIAAQGSSAKEDTTYPIDKELSNHILSALNGEGFDITAMKTLEAGPKKRKGMSHAYGFVYNKLMTKTIPAVHICLNTFYPPNQPSAARCVALGEAIGRAVTNYDNNLRVAICGSGGLTHFVIDETFDK
ncbi:MAG: protocatechuate 3,4-dioxygenase, partial [Kordiimonadaceae bacterium]|nr:protocatechuate 3,4-dioxygenase [Kordiimonadaceae bacterium]